MFYSTLPPSLFDRRVNDVHKYGICGKPFNKDGSSPRANEQVDFLNRAMHWACIFCQNPDNGYPRQGESKGTGGFLY
ncbi:MAG: hypothetical protein H6577_03585 [Lewinellaceae bacterium]|nr:hypothetical protein [Saprospiraceae bacterium]MCB9337186.1 hypothetical protein [Lewinellaceae bacterium]